MGENVLYGKLHHFLLLHHHITCTVGVWSSGLALEGRSMGGVHSLMRFTHASWGLEYSGAVWVQGHTKLGGIDTIACRYGKILDTV